MVTEKKKDVKRWQVFNNSEKPVAWQRKVKIFTLMQLIDKHLHLLLVVSMAWC